jgi:hypothetical protein
MEVRNLVKLLRCANNIFLYIHVIEWVDVITDTRLPCVRDESNGYFMPVYSKTPNRGEMWIPFAEKAYAKAVGSYESIIKIKVHEALLHLTGCNLALKLIAILC